MSSSRWLLMLSVTVLCLAGLAHTMLASDGWSRHSRLARDLYALRAENDATEEHLQTLRNQIDALNGRREVQEHVIRDELGYVRPGDLVINFDATP